MKKQLYRITKSGIRIPKEKIKWMPPLEGKSSDVPKLPTLSDKEFADLFTRNFNSLLRSDLSAESEGGGEYFGEEGM